MKKVNIDLSEYRNDLALLNKVMDEIAKSEFLFEKYNLKLYVERIN